MHKHRHLIVLLNRLQPSLVPAPTQPPEDVTAKTTVPTIDATEITPSQSNYTIRLRSRNRQNKTGDKPKGRVGRPPLKRNGIVPSKRVDNRRSISVALSEFSIDDYLSLTHFASGHNRMVTRRQKNAYQTEQGTAQDKMSQPAEQQQTRPMSLRSRGRPTNNMTLAGRPMDDHFVYFNATHINHWENGLVEHGIGEALRCGNLSTTAKRRKGLSMLENKKLDRKRKKKLGKIRKNTRTRRLPQKSAQAPAAVSAPPEADEPGDNSLSPIVSHPCRSDEFVTIKGVVQASPQELSKCCGKCERCRIVQKVQCLSKMVRILLRRQTSPADIYEFDAENEDVMENTGFNNFRLNRQRTKPKKSLPKGSVTLYIDLLPENGTQIIQITADHENEKIIRARLVPNSQSNGNEVSLLEHENLLNQLYSILNTTSKVSLEMAETAQDEVAPTPTTLTAAEIQHPPPINTTNEESDPHRPVTPSSILENVSVTDDEYEYDMISCFDEAPLRPVAVSPTFVIVQAAVNDCKEFQLTEELTIKSSNEEFCNMAGTIDVSKALSGELTPPVLSENSTAAAYDKRRALYTMLPEEAVASTSSSPCAAVSQRTESETSAEDLIMEDDPDVILEEHPTPYPSRSDAILKRHSFPKGVEKAQMMDAPVFYPTVDEFQDPVAYIEKITPKAAKFGICKVVAPKCFTPTCTRNDNIHFTPVNQYVARLYSRWGAAQREMCAIKAYLASQSVIFTRAPLLERTEINMPKLFSLVEYHGGLKRVIEKNFWWHIIKEMDLAECLHPVRKLELIYVKYLLPYATLSDQERRKILRKVERGWYKKNQKLLDRALNPLHRQKKLLAESESSEEEEEEEDTHVTSALIEAEDCVVPGRKMNISSFKRVAENVMNMHFPGAHTKYPTVNDVESQYWRLVLLATEHVCVNSASINTDNEDIGFTKNKNDLYGNHPWNLKISRLKRVFCLLMLIDRQ